MHANGESESRGPGNVGLEFGRLATGPTKRRCDSHFQSKQQSSIGSPGDRPQCHSTRACQEFSKSPRSRESPRPYVAENQECQGEAEASCSFVRNFWRRQRFWTVRSLIPRPPLSLGKQTSSQGALHAPPEQVFSPVQRKARLFASM